MFGSDWPRTLD